jgi:hypothetical protein
MAWSSRSRRAATRIAVVAGLCLAVIPTVRAQSGDCAVAVIVEGTEPARTEIANELARAGVPATPAPGCAVETVAVAVQGAALDLTITDPYGRVTHRTVADLHAASAVIESTPGSEVLRPLLPEVAALPAPQVLRPGDDPGDDEPAVQSAGVAPGPAAVVSDARAAERPPGRGLSLLMATEVATGSDGSGWAGLSVTGCVTLGPTCLGTRVRFWRDLDADDEAGGTIGQRATGEIALSLDVPFTRHRIDIRPGVELGLGWIHMGELVVHPQASDDADFDQGEVLTGVHVGASYPISQHWALEAGLGASLSLFAHHSPFTVQGVQLPGEPLAFGLASLGLRYGSP